MTTLKLHLHALRVHLRTAAPNWTQATLAKHLGVNPQTVARWGVDPNKFPARAAFSLAKTFDLGGLVYTSSPERTFDSFEELLSQLTTLSDQQRMTDTSLAKHLGLSAGHLARYYRSTPEYAGRNLCLAQVDAWARAVGLSGVTFATKVLADNRWVPGFNDEEHQAAAARSVADGSPGLSMQHLVETHPQTPGLHLPLPYLIKSLQAERIRRGLSLEDLIAVAPAHVLGLWEQGLILSQGRGAPARELTLGALDRWSQALGFGRTFCPVLGYDWSRAISIIDATISAAPALSFQYLGVLWGAGPRASAVLRGGWRAIPAAFFEYLAIWAYADGLAFEFSNGRRGWSQQQAAAAVECANRRLHTRMSRLVATGRKPKRGNRQFAETMDLRRLCAEQGGYFRFPVIEPQDYKQTC